MVVPKSVVAPYKSSYCTSIGSCSSLVSYSWLVEYHFISKTCSHGRKTNAGAILLFVGYYCPQTKFTCFYTCLWFCSWVGCTSPLRQTDTPQQTLPPWADTLPPRDGHCSRRHASYWNAFMFQLATHVEWRCWSKLLLSPSVSSP